MPKKVAQTPGTSSKKSKETMPAAAQKSIGMIDIADKTDVTRTATVEGTIVLKKSTIKKIREGTIKKGDVFSVSSVAAIQAVKKTSDFIPLCHPIPIHTVKTTFAIADDETAITARVFVKSIGKTGVEMEALAGVAAALLSVWDMTKYLEKDDDGQYPSTAITSIAVVEKVKQ